jgi:spore coat protein A
MRALGIIGILASACVEPAPPDAELREEFLLPIPPVAQPTRSDASGDYYTITQRPAVQQVVPRAEATPIEGYNGTWPGPTIVAHRGRPSIVTQTNQLGHPITVHNHGHKAPPQDDGHPADLVAPGASREYRYPNDQAAGTFWLHDHTMNVTGPNLWNGLASMYIIKDDIWDRLNLPSGEFDVPLIIQDRKFHGDGTFNYPSPPFGDVACVNGARTPRMQVARRRYLFRLLNGSDHRVFRMLMQPFNYERGVSAPYVPFKVVASDGGLLSRSVYKEALVIAPAERYAIVVDFSNYPVGSSVVMRNTFAVPPPQLPLADIMRFDIVRDAPDDSSPTPDVLLPTPIERFDPDKADVTRVVELGRADSDVPDHGNWQINGKMYDPARIDFRAKLGQTEVWNLVNSTNANHTIHVHLVQFQIIELEGGLPPEEQRGWKDTVLLTPNVNAKIMMRWEGYKGLYVFHCHIIGHEDQAMMAQIEVAD